MLHVVVQLSEVKVSEGAGEWDVGRLVGHVSGTPACKNKREN